MICELGNTPPSQQRCSWPSKFWSLCLSIIDAKRSNPIGFSLMANFSSAICGGFAQEWFTVCLFIPGTAFFCRPIEIPRRFVPRVADKCNLILSYLQYYPLEA